MGCWSLAAGAVDFVSGAVNTPVKLSDCPHCDVQLGAPADALFTCWLSYLLLASAYLSMLPEKQIHKDMQLTFSSTNGELIYEPGAAKLFL